MGGGKQLHPGNVWLIFNDRQERAIRPSSGLRRPDPQLQVAKCDLASEERQLLGGQRVPRQPAAAQYVDRGTGRRRTQGGRFPRCGVVGR